MPQATSSQRSTTLRPVAPDRKSGVPVLVTAGDAAIGAHPSEAGIEKLRIAYRASGGIATSDDLARLVESYAHLDVARLARLIVGGGVFGFDWQHAYWIPMFQFQRQDLSIKSGPQRVAAVLGSVFDGWTLCAWFAQPNSWLNDRRPVDLLDTEFDAVLYAARGDLFLWNS